MRRLGFCFRPEKSLMMVYFHNSIQCPIPVKADNEQSFPHVRAILGTRATILMHSLPLRGLLEQYYLGPDSGFSVRKNKFNDQMIKFVYLSLPTDEGIFSGVKFSQSRVQPVSLVWFLFHLRCRGRAQHASQYTGATLASVLTSSRSLVTSPSFSPRIDSMKCPPTQTHDAAEQRLDRSHLGCTIRSWSKRAPNGQDFRLLQSMFLFRRIE